MNASKSNTSIFATERRRAVSINSMKRKNYFWGYFMIAPLMIGLLLFNIWPIFMTAYYSLTRYQGLNSPKFIGIGNYTHLFQDPAFFLSLKNTLIYTLMTVPVGLFISIIFAVLVNSGIRGSKIFRTIHFLPQVTLPAAVAMSWMWLLNVDYGLVNQFLKIFGIDKINWLSDPHYVMLSIVIVSIWGSIGYNMIILISGLQDIPAGYYEAAQIDGASSRATFFKITLPLLSPTIFFLVVTSLINAMELFDIIWLMIRPTNPAIDNVRSLVYTYYESAFIQYDKGYGAAIAVFLFVLILIITMIQMKMQKKWVYYE